MGRPSKEDVFGACDMVPARTQMVARYSSSEDHQNHINIGGNVCLDCKKKVSFDTAISIKDKSHQPGKIRPTTIRFLGPERCWHRCRLQVKVPIPPPRLTHNHHAY